METTVEQPRGLVRKLAEIMAAVERVPKRGRNNFHGYDYATEADIVAVVRGEMAKRGVMLIPAVTNHERHDLRDGVDKNGNAKPRDPLTVLHMTFSFVDGETGERESHPWLGVGQDVGDKGAYKAMTGGEKYFLMKVFLMPTGDDPEADKKEARKAEREPQPPPPPTTPRTIDRAEQKQMVDAAELAGWRAVDVQRLLASHGFKKSTEVTVDKLPAILDALKHGASVPPPTNPVADNVVPF